ncbi:adenosylcobinamide-phosphate synthase CbiB [Kallotenue papyrolyticum]|uniref:adenosylcobinamide-phosphate synthase CbiB n=1 Tax=Kallotenue papyrolyticum TaxID=1325125 RepID=UPI000478658E|nr:adenosylcobinamide-phosphate synthase CbiB [Kallotenue papyrolyticum]
MSRLRTALLMLLLDSLLPEPPTAWHPVGWMGRWLRLGERLAPAGARARTLWGGLWFGGGMVLCMALARRVPAAGEALVGQTLLAYRALDRAVAQVATALAHGDLPAARRLVGWHLVSRPTATLTAEDVAAAAIESLAENLSDSVVAPLSWYLIGGLPALAAYRFSNTADALWGYRTPRYLHLGRVAARCDDLLNLLPARLTAALIALAAARASQRGRAAWRMAWRDARATVSPNAGWPMAAMAGALGVRLGKPGVYELGAGPPPGVAQVATARCLARQALGWLALVLGLAYRIRRRA